MALESLHRKWQEEGKGYLIDYGNGLSFDEFWEKLRQAHPDNAKSQLYSFTLSCLAYLDDCYLIAKSVPEMQLMLNDLTQVFEKLGLQINTKKCKWVTDKHSHPFE